MGKEITRICGEGKVVIKDSNLYFLPTYVVRGFEKMLEGKHPLFVTETVMRPLKMRWTFIPQGMG